MRTTGDPALSTLILAGIFSACVFLTHAGTAQTGPAESPSRLEVDATAFPWSPIGRLNIGGRGHCTGFMIGENRLLTAAHCLYDSTGNRWRAANELHFLAAYQREDYSLHSPVKSYEVSTSFHPERSVSPENAATDWAVVRIEKPLGRQTGWFGLRRLDAGVLKRLREGRATLLQAGYQRGRAQIITAAFGCKVVGLFAQNAGFAHDCPVDKGDSGSPLLLLDRGLLSVAGIHVIQATWDGRDIAGVLSFNLFHPQETAPAMLPASKALQAHWGPGQRPPRGGRITQLPLTAIDGLLHNLGFLPVSSAPTSADREEGIKKFQLSQSITRDGQASLQLLEQLILAQNQTPSAPPGNRN
jgi:V8-like Glu-specific endopeptidase